MTMPKTKHTPDGCLADVWNNWQHYPCRNKAKKDGFCMTHHPDKLKARQDKAELKTKARDNARAARLKAAIVAEDPLLRSAADMLAALEAVNRMFLPSALPAIDKIITAAISKARGE